MQGLRERSGLPSARIRGWPVVFVELGQDVHVVGRDLNERSTRVSAEATRRLSSGLLLDPLTRGISGTILLPSSMSKWSKGIGSGFKWPQRVWKRKHEPRGPLLAGEGIEAVKKFVIQRVEEAGPNPCPPLVVGVGIGGTFEKAALIAKKSLLRPLGKRHPDPSVAKLESEDTEGDQQIGDRSLRAGRKDNSPGCPY